MQRAVKGLQGLDRLVAGIEVGAVTAALLAMVGLYSWHVVLRNTGQGGVPAFQLVVQHLVLWVAMLGASLATRERKHIAIEVVDKAISPSGRRVKEALLAGSTFVLCLVLAYVSRSYVLFERAQYEGSPSPEPLFTLLRVEVPRWWSLSILPIGFGLMAARYLLRVCERVFLDETVDEEAEVRREIEAYEARHSSSEDAFASARRPSSSSSDDGEGER